jgi:hypothetical protein
VNYLRKIQKRLKPYKTETTKCVLRFSGAATLSPLLFPLLCKNFARCFLAALPIFALATADSTHFLGLVMPRPADRKPPGTRFELLAHKLP